MLAELVLPQLEIPSKIDDCGRQFHSDVYSDISRLVCASVSPVHTDSSILDEDQLSSPVSPPAHNYVHPYDNSPASPTLYESEQATSNYSYDSARIHPSHNYPQAAVSSLRDSEPGASYLSDSPAPSPVDVHSSSTFHHPLLPHDRYPSGSTYPTSAHISDRRLAQSRNLSLPDPPPFPAHLLDQRRTSEPQVHYPISPMDPTGYPYDHPEPGSSQSRSNRTPAYLQRGRDLRYLDHPQADSAWRQTPDDLQPSHSAYRTSLAMDEPVSPYQASFSGGHGSPTDSMSWPNENQYGASSPGTGQPPASPDSDSKRYSFVALPGNAVKKRPRRRYDEIERLYQCSWPDCNKAYGTLNHLNAHVTMQKHGSKRSPNEFKELRKQWRKAKKEAEFSQGGIIRRNTLLDNGMYEPRMPATMNHRYSYPSPMSHANLPHLGNELPFPADRNQGHRVGERGSYNDERERYPPPPWTPESYNRSTNTLSSVPFPSLPSISASSQHSLHPVNNMLSPVRTEFRRDSPRLTTDHRLSANSTLMTPLPGYQPPASLLSPVNHGIDVEFGGEGYYTGERGRRPSSGHPPMGCNDEVYRREEF